MPIERVTRGQEWQPPKADDWEQIANHVDAQQSANNSFNNVAYLSSIYSDQRIGINSVWEIVDSVPSVPTNYNFRTEQDYLAKQPAGPIEKIGNVVVPATSADVQGEAKVYPDGLAKIVVNIVNELHQFAYPTQAEATKMTSGGMGFRIVYRAEPGTGDKWCIIRTSHFYHTHFWGVTDQAIAANASGTVTVTKGTISAGVQYPVHNDIYGEDVGQGVIVTCKHFEPERAQIQTAACEEDTGGGGPVFPNPVV